MCSVQLTVCSVQWAVCSVQWAVCSVHCAVCKKGLMCSVGTLERSCLQGFVPHKPLAENNVDLCYNYLLAVRRIDISVSQMVNTIEGHKYSLFRGHFFFIHLCTILDIHNYFIRYRNNNNL